MPEKIIQTLKKRYTLNGSIFKAFAGEVSLTLLEGKKVQVRLPNGAIEIWQKAQLCNFTIPEGPQNLADHLAASIKIGSLIQLN